MKTKTITFAELREFLKSMSFKQKTVDIDNGFDVRPTHVFYRGKKKMLLFRFYNDEDLVSPRELASTQSFLDWWGVLAAADFDAFLIWCDNAGMS